MSVAGAVGAASVRRSPGPIHVTRPTLGVAGRCSHCGAPTASHRRENGVNTEYGEPSGLVTVPGSTAYGLPSPQQPPTVGLQSCSNLGVASSTVRSVVATDEHRVGAKLGGNRRYDVCRIAVAEDHRSPEALVRSASAAAMYARRGAPDRCVNNGSTTNSGSTSPAASRPQVQGDRTHASRVGTTGSNEASAGQCPLRFRAVPHPGPHLVLLVRHGATEWSASGRHTGRTDVDLTEHGHEQTMMLRNVLYRLIDSRHTDPPQPPMVFTSTLKRARQTAALAMPEADPEEAHQLVEVDYGDYEGLTSAQIHDKNPDWDLFKDGCPGGESMAAVSARCDSFIAKMERMASGRTVVVFTHGHFSRILTARMLGLPGSAGSVLYNETATVGVLDHRHGELVLTGWNISGD